MQYFHFPERSFWTCDGRKCGGRCGVRVSSLSIVRLWREEREGHLGGSSQGKVSGQLVEL